MGTDKHSLHLPVASAASSFTNNNTNSHRQAEREHVNTQLLVATKSIVMVSARNIKTHQQCLWVNENKQSKCKWSTK